ncbi:hypothetical protein [Caldifermentibacillus hisashii]|uniref:hypothetical protein n=1 Tax=Caldifermentibacillus hisashii TaxID=996558 RepID=UPI0022B9B8F2|nr:hypothetical protein [Caldifermentibacillus hisashii]
MMTKPNLVVVLRQERPNFDDETYSRRQFEERNAVFWRRGPISLLILTEFTTIKFLGIRWLNVF